jgi:hypothetical protein
MLKHLIKISSDSWIWTRTLLRLADSKLIKEVTRRMFVRQTKTSFESQRVLDLDQMSHHERRPEHRADFLCNILLR